MNFKKHLAASVVLTLAAPPQPYYDMILEGNARALFGDKDFGGK